MIIEETTDTDLVLDILKSPGIAEHICDDPSDFKGFKFDGSERFLMGYYEDNELIGCAIFDKHQGFNTVHLNVLKEMRKSCSKTFFKMCYSWFEKNIGGDLYAIIPTKCPNVLDFAINMGFEVFGNEGLDLKLVRYGNGQD